MVSTLTNIWLCSASYIGESVDKPEKVLGQNSVGTIQGLSRSTKKFTDEPSSGVTPSPRRSGSLWEFAWPK